MDQKLAPMSEDISIFPKMQIVIEVLAERLKKVIGNLVSGYQNAFIKGRQITDAALIANEVLDWRQKSGVPGLLFKLDIEKAFDKINWHYLFSIMRQMGFGERWIKWIRYSITTVKYSVLINRSPVGFFSPMRGIRQGNPLSPFLFILAMEGLSKMMEKAKHLQWIKGFDVGNNSDSSVSVSHLLFADDTLIFCGAEKSQVQYLNLTLMLFEALSGLHINMFKSIIYPVNVVPDLEELAEIMCCNTGLFPTTYLGLPLGAKHRSTEIWNVIIEKFEKRLASWQQQYLSFGGRLTLINSVLDSIPTYFMSLFSIPGKVQKKLDKIRRDFLWEGSNKDHKFHLVKWPKVTLPKALGGLGVKDLALHSKSMLMKWHWKYNQAEPSFWKNVVQAKYGSSSHWCTNTTRTPHGTGIWKGIRNLWEEFSLNTLFHVGDGELIWFWKDKWLGDTTLKDVYPSIFLIAINPNSTIAQNRMDNSWDLRLRRNLNDWEMDEFTVLHANIQNTSLTSQRIDKLKWGSSKEGFYSVKEAYLLLNSNKDLIDQWPWKLIWRTRLPSKVICFSWIALKGACLTQDNLIRRNFQLVNRCYMCRCNSETIDHLFLHCPIASDIWNMFLSLFGIHWAMPCTVREAFVSWSSWKVEKPIKTIWAVVPSCILWCLWIERNQRCFDGTSTAIHSLKARCLVNLYSWVNHIPVLSLDSFIEFISSLAL